MFLNFKNQLFFVNKNAGKKVSLLPAFSKVN